MNPADGFSASIFPGLPNYTIIIVNALCLIYLEVQKIEHYANCAATGVL